MAAAHANARPTAEKSSKHHDSTREDDRQTILHMKRIIENLKNENAKLRKVTEQLTGELRRIKSSKTSASSDQNDKQRKLEQHEHAQMKSQHEKLLRRFNELLNKTSRLEVEHELAQSQAINYSCPHCNKNLGEMASKDADVLSQQLQEKIQLLDRAKSLLSRSLCTEKHLRMKIAELKKRICELEGVPAISEENSDASQL